MVIGHGLVKQFFFPVPRMESDVGLVRVPNPLPHTGNLSSRQCLLWDMLFCIISSDDVSFLVLDNNLNMSLIVHGMQACFYFSTYFHATILYKQS